MVVLLVILTICFFVGLDLIHQKMKPGREEKKAAVPIASASVYKSFLEMIRSGEFKVPQGLFLSRGHVWSRLLPQGDLMLGIDNFVVKLLGKVDKFDLHRPGEKVNSQGWMCVIKQGRKKLKLYSPFEGMINEVNGELQRDAHLIEGDPYIRGWVYRITPAMDLSHIKRNTKADVSNVIWLQKEMERLTSFISGELPSHPPLKELIWEKKFSLNGVLQRMDSFAWLKFQETFLK